MLGLERRGQRQDLGLHRDVQRGRRLVGDEEPRAQRERHRDHDPLAHAARELVRIHGSDLRRPLDADLGEEVDRLTAGVTAPGAVARLEHLRDLEAGRQDRVERRHGVLGEVADQPPARAAQIGSGEARDVDAVHTHRARGDLTAGRQEPRDRQRERRLARPRLADDRHRAPLLHGDRRLGHRLERAVVNRDALDLEERRHPASSTPGPRVDEHADDVGDEVEGDHDHRRDDDRAHEERPVELVVGLLLKLADARPCEDGLDEDDAGQVDRDIEAGQRDHRREAVSDHVPAQDHTPRKALRHGRSHVRRGQGRARRLRARPRRSRGRRRGRASPPGESAPWRSCLRPAGAGRAGRRRPRAAGTRASRSGSRGGPTFAAARPRLRLRRRPSHSPRPPPRITSTIRPPTASTAVAGRRSMIRSMTGRRRMYDTPRSPCATSVT